MGAILRHFRLLPLTGAVALVIMMVKLNAVWDGFAAMRAGGAVISSANAATGEAPSAAGHAEGAAPAKNGHGAGDGEKAGAVPHAQESKDEQQAPAEQPAAEAVAGPRLTPSEIEVLQQLARRREELARRAEALDRREDLLKAAEHRVDAKLQGLKDLQATLERLIAEYKAQQDEQAQTLVKIYENMKPKDAARIFEELEMGTLLAVADRMKERKLAPVLADMNPARAKEVTEELARLRSLPTPSGAADADKRP